LDQALYWNAAGRERKLLFLKTEAAAEFQPSGLAMVWHNWSIPKGLLKMAFTGRAELTSLS